MSTVSKKKYPNKKPHKSESEDEDSEHELFYYVNDRIKLMKEVLKVLKPRKIKAMAPDCLKDLDTEELNSMLLEELLGISKKRLKKIFEGENNDDESSSESDEEPIDIISLDDITDDDDIGIIEIIDSTSNADANKKRRKHKKYHPKRIKFEKNIEIKKEKDAESIVENSSRRKKADKEKKNTSKNTQEGENEKLLSVLELLELQARARAIKSQLIIEAENKHKASLEKANELKASQSNKETIDNESEDDAVIINNPKEEEIIIPSSDSEDNTISQHEIEIENSKNNAENVIIDVDKEDKERQIEKPKQPKFRIIRNRLIKPSQNLEGLTITVTNDKAKIIPHNTNKNVDKEVKTETLANVSEFIGPSLGPVEMIHLDTLDVDLNEITLPEQDLCIKKKKFEECMDKVLPEFTKELSQERKSLNKDVQIASQSSSNPLNNYVSKEKNFTGPCTEIIEKVSSDPEAKYEENKKNETEQSESKDDNEDNRYSDGDDVLLLDALVDE